MKAPNGYGAVIYLGKGRRNPWAVRISNGYENGIRKYLYISYHKTKKEAASALAKMQGKNLSDRINFTLKQIYEDWKGSAFSKISKQLQDNYSAAFNHLKPLHNKKFSFLRSPDYQKIIDELDRGQSTKRKIKVLCTQIYKYAMEIDLVDKNYAQFIKLDKEEKAEKEIFTDLEIQKIAADNSPYADTVLILIYTGLRISEFLELTPFNVDLKSNVIRGGLKTDAGKDRVIPILPQIRGHIEKWVSEGQSTLIHRDGKPISPDYYRRRIFKPIMDKLGIKNKTPHNCRHTCATILTQNKVDPVAIKAILGHTDFSFTVDTYTHADTDFLQAEMNKIAK